MAKVIKVDIVIVNMSSVFSLLQPSKKTSTKVAIDGINNGRLKVDGGLNESWWPQSCWQPQS